MYTSEASDGAHTGRMTAACAAHNAGWAALLTGVPARTRPILFVRFPIYRRLGKTERHEVVQAFGHRRRRGPRSWSGVRPRGRRRVRRPAADGSDPRLADPVLGGGRQRGRGGLAAG